MERRWADQHAVRKGSLGRLLLGVNAVSNRSAVHEDDRVMAVLARQGGGQPRDVSRLGAPGNLLKAGRREMVTFVHDQMTVLANAIIHHAVANQTLHQRHVQSAGGLLLPSPDAADGLGGQPEKSRESLHPLLHQLLVGRPGSGC